MNKKTVSSDVEKTVHLERHRGHLQARQGQKFNVYIVSLETIGDTPQEVQDSLDELGSLIRSLGDECVGATIQKRSKIDPALFIGLGKVQELATIFQELKVDYVVFDKNLSAPQVRNLEKLLWLPVMDRTHVILEIFRKNAKSKESKTQVQLAHLEYLAPRLSNSWVAFERQRGGAQSKGAGEMQLEIDRRHIKRKIFLLKKQLEKIEQERLIQREGRKDEMGLVLVGYTNAGKTSLMNALTRSNLSAKDSLFETLDSSVRQLAGVKTPRILVTDTVGFIQNLPHGLVASFRSTLMEVKWAQLILHVVDVSHPKFREHIDTTQQVLEEVGAKHVPVFFVFNKADKLQQEPQLSRLLTRHYGQSLVVSAQKKEDIQKLKNAIVLFFTQDMMEKTFSIPTEDQTHIQRIYAHTEVLNTEYGDNHITFKVRITKRILDKYFHSLLEDENHGQTHTL